MPTGAENTIAFIMRKLCFKKGILEMPDGICYNAYRQEMRLYPSDTQKEPPVAATTEGSSLFKR